MFARTHRLLGVAVVLSSILILAATASGETTHVYPVSLTIAVDRSEATLSGTIVTEAPSEFCDSARVLLRVVMPGEDKVLASPLPHSGEWQIISTPRLRGKRVYAEVLAYHLPSRPVECLGARSRAVTAP